MLGVGLNVKEILDLSCCRAKLAALVVNAHPYYLG